MDEHPGAFLRPKNWRRCKLTRVRFRHTIGQETHAFPDLRTLLAKASPTRAADRLAELTAETETSRVAARFALADVPLRHFLTEDVIPAELDEVTRLIHAQHDATAFAPIASLTVAELRDWLLRAATSDLTAVREGLTPEMVAASRSSCATKTWWRGAQVRGDHALPQHASGCAGGCRRACSRIIRLDDPRGVAASILDGLLLGSGDAVIGINPATDDPRNVTLLLRLIDELRSRYDIPTQSCVLSHVTTTQQLMAAGAPVDLVFQSIAGTEAANRSFRINLALLREAHEQRFR